MILYSYIINENTDGGAACPALPSRVFRVVGHLAVLCMLLTALAACSRPPSPAQQAFQALKRMELRTNRLVWHDEYTLDLEQAKAAVNVFLAGPEAAAKPDLAASLQAALFDYDLAGKLWGILRHASQTSPSPNIRRVCMKRSSTTGGLLTAYLRSLDKLPAPGADGCSMDEIEITGQVSFLWEHAAGQLKKAEAILQR